MKKLFVDSDVVLDYFLGRKDYDAAASLFQFSYEKKCKLVTSSLVMANVFYIASKVLRRGLVVKQMKLLRKFCGVIPVSEKAFDKALNSHIHDFEDAMQYFAALEIKVNAIITRNKKDFKNAKIPVLTAKEFLSNEDY